jgi:hypothetical protein
VQELPTAAQEGSSKQESLTRPCCVYNSILHDVMHLGYDWKILPKILPKMTCCLSSAALSSAYFMVMRALYRSPDRSPA